MNVFLDSTELYNDPFLKNYWHRLLLKICEEYECRLFISRVVIDETRNNVRNQMGRLIPKCEIDLGDLDKLLPQTNELNREITYTVEQFEQDYDTYYEESVQRGLIEIIEPGDGLLMETIHRAINGKKPFSTKKDEFRDCVIWLSYVNETTTEDLEDCYFITNNTRDFYNAEKTDLHDELKNDSDKFCVFMKTSDLINAIPHLIHMRQEIETREWVENGNIDDDYILQFITEYQLDKVQYDLEDFINKLQPYEIDKDLNLCEVGNVWLTDIDIDRVSSIDTDIIEDEILCWGLIDMTIEIEIEEYNPMADTPNEKYLSRGSRTLKIQATFDLAFTKEKTINEFSLDNIRIEKVY